MTALRVGNLKLEALTGIVSLEGATVRVALKGNADMSSHAAFRDFVGAVHTDVMKAGAKVLELDLNELYFMNSSCLSILAGLIGNVAASPQASRYRIVLRTNQNLRWQKRSVQALSSFAADLVTVL